jgi:hypothetical protein
MKKNLRNRREGALARLKESKFFEKNGRTQEAWQKRKDREIKILEKRVSML